MKTIHFYNFSKGQNNYIAPSMLGEDTASHISNAVIDGGVLKPFREPANTGFSDPTMFDFYGNEKRSVVKWFGEYYWSDNVLRQYGGTKNLGITKPIVLLNIISSGSGVLNGNYKYCITYVRDGWESPPSQLNGDWYSTITLTNQKVSYTIPETIPSDIEHIRVYRTVSSGSEFYLVDEHHRLLAGSVREDNISDLDILLNNSLDSHYYDMPPVNGKFLTESNGVFFVAVDDKLYFSYIQNPHAWNGLNWVGFESNITGIVSDYQGVLVFTYNKTYRVQGTDISTIYKQEIPGQQGCVNWRTIAKVSNYPVWLSNDGICIWDGHSIDIVTKGRIDLTKYTFFHAVSANDIYYIYHGGGALCFDVRNGGVFSEIDLTCDYGWFDSETDHYYLFKDSAIYEFNKGSGYLQLTYSSGILKGSSFSVKFFRLIRVKSDNDVRFIIEDEEERILTAGSAKGKKNKVIFLPGHTCRGLKIKLESRGTIYEISAEYEEHV